MSVAPLALLTFFCFFFLPAEAQPSAFIRAIGFESFFTFPNKRLLAGTLSCGSAALGLVDGS